MTLADVVLETPKLLDIHLRLEGYIGREVEGVFIVNNPKTGALSALNQAEMVAFQQIETSGTLEAARSILIMLGQSQESATQNINNLVTKLSAEGWTRTDHPVSQVKPLAAVYFTLTRECNLACPYCYQGLRRRATKIMPVSSAKAILSEIHEVNEDAHIIITGGEPMMHPDFFEILDLIADFGFTSSLLTHGGFIDRDAARKFAGHPGLERVQVSIDGITEGVHKISRGPKSYHDTIKGIELLAEAGAPLLLAPTIHDGNAHEILDIAKYALSLGGSISANDLQQLPQDENTSLSLSPENRKMVKSQLSDYLTQTMLDDKSLSERIAKLNTRSCSADPINSRFICGVAYALVDIDWNGDVYPCHLLKGEGLSLGNLAEVGFAEVFLEGHIRGWRAKSHEIENCSSCSFMSVCGSGCRASTYFTYGTPKKSSPICNELRYGNTRRMLKMKGVEYSGQR